MYDMDMNDTPIVLGMKFRNLVHHRTGNGRRSKLISVAVTCTVIEVGTYRGFDGSYEGCRYAWSIDGATYTHQSDLHHVRCSIALHADK